MSNRIVKNFVNVIGMTSLVSLFTGCGAPGANPYMPNPVPGSACRVNLISPNRELVKSFSFSANGMIKTEKMILAGDIPLADNQPLPFKPALNNGGKTAGDAIVAPGGAVTTGQYVGQGVDGSIYMNLQENQNGSIIADKYSMTLNGSGTVILSQASIERIPGYQQVIAPMYPGYPGAPLPYNAAVPSLCVNDVAVSMNWTPGGGGSKLDWGRVYVFISTPSIPGYPNTGSGSFQPTGYPKGIYLQF